MSHETVHVFASTGRFRTSEALRAFVHPAYTEDGDAVPSEFAREVGLCDFEPMCIECVTVEQPVPLAELLQGASYAEQWLPEVDGTRVADAAICVFPPNRLRHPERCSVPYVGGFPLRAPS